MDNKEFHEVYDKVLNVHYEETVRFLSLIGEEETRKAVELLMKLTIQKINFETFLKKKALEIKDVLIKYLVDIFKELKNYFPEQKTQEFLLKEVEDYLKIVENIFKEFELKNLIFNKHEIIKIVKENQ
jgi:hypothetical protein